MLVNCPRALASNWILDSATARGSRMRCITRKFGSIRNRGSMESIVARTDLTARSGRLEQSDRSKEMHRCSTCARNPALSSGKRNVTGMQTTRIFTVGVVSDYQTKNNTNISFLYLFSRTLSRTETLRTTDCTASFKRRRNCT